MPDQGADPWDQCNAEVIIRSLWGLRFGPPQGRGGASNVESGPPPARAMPRAGAEGSEAEGWNLVAIGIGRGPGRRGKLWRKRRLKQWLNQRRKQPTKKPFSSREGLAASRRLDSGRSFDAAPQLAAAAEGGSGAEEGDGAGGCS